MHPKTPISRKLTRKEKSEGGGRTTPALSFLEKAWHSDARVFRLVVPSQL